MSTVTFTGTEILVGIGLLAFIVLSFMLYRLMSELTLTLRQVRRTVRELERTIQNSQEVIYNVKSITRTVDSELKDVGEIVSAARGTVEHIQSAASSITRPISQFRSLMSGLGFVAKYLLKRKRSDDYEDDE
jgi:uncharacterized protein YoxC